MVVIIFNSLLLELHNYRVLGVVTMDVVLQQGNLQSFVFWQVGRPSRVPLSLLFRFISYTT